MNRPRVPISGMYRFQSWPIESSASRQMYSKMISNTLRSEKRASGTSPSALTLAPTRHAIRSETSMATAIDWAIAGTECSNSW